MSRGKGKKKRHKIGSRTIFTYIMWCASFIATIITIRSGITVSSERHHSLATLTSNMTKFVRGNNILYLDSIKNDSEAHAKDITFKAQFKNAIVRRFYVEPNVDLIDKKEIKYRNPKNSACFFLKRLSYNSYCDITIIVTSTKADMQESIDLTWENRGHITIMPQQASEKSQLEYENKYKSSGETADESFSARKKWFERNTKGISK